MTFEKKMLILCGDGKGVVLTERTAHGVGFSVRTFDLARRDRPLKIGVVTPKRVFVRDLPDCDDPAAAFTLQDCDTADMHVAVFDDRLRLYGATGKKMWEANVMGLLLGHERRLREPTPTPLPPIAPPPLPKELPLPDGTGLPQSRIAVYGDDAIAENDFYTPLSDRLKARMPEVDGFLNSERVLDLDALAPRVTPRPPLTEPRPAPQEADALLPEQTDRQSDGDLPVEADEVYVEPQAENARDLAAKTQAENADYRPENGINPEKSDARATDVLTEAAATQSEAAMPWQATAAWLKRRSTREIVPVTPRPVPKPAQNPTKLRESSFFERTRADLEKLFASAPKDEELCRLLPDIEWIKVTFDGNAVSVGKGADAFLCYAVFGDYDPTPPFGERSQWLPRDKNAPSGSGYWLIFQNARTGEILG